MKLKNSVLRYGFISRKKKKTLKFETQSEFVSDKDAQPIDASSLIQ